MPKKKHGRKYSEHRAHVPSQPTTTPKPIRNTPNTFPSIQTHNVTRTNIHTNTHKQTQAQTLQWPTHKHEKTDTTQNCTQTTHLHHEDAPHAYTLNNTRNATQISRKAPFRSSLLHRRARLSVVGARHPRPWQNKHQEPFINYFLFYKMCIMLSCPASIQGIF